MYGWSRQHVFYYLNKPKKAVLSVVKVNSGECFELTLRSQNFLGSCEGVLLGSGVFHLKSIWFGLEK